MARLSPSPSFARGFILLLIPLNLAVLGVSLCLGDMIIPISDVWNSLFAHPADWIHAEVIRNLRLPRTLLAGVVGAVLAWSGVCLQALFRNPMAEPYFAGVSSGAALGGTLALVAGIGGALGISGIGVGAFAGAVVSVLAVYRLARFKGRTDVTSLVLAGLAVSALLSSLVSLILMLHRERLEHVLLWTMGSFSAASWDKLIFAAAAGLIGMVPAFLFRRELNLMLLGDEGAHSLGVSVERTRLILLLFTSLAAAAAVAVSGIIGFVGILVPHAARMVLGPDSRSLLPASALLGAAFLMGADLLARLVLAPVEIPIGIITAITGAPFFIMLMVQSGRRSA